MLSGYYSLLCCTKQGFKTILRTISLPNTGQYPPMGLYLTFMPPSIRPLGVGKGKKEERKDGRR